MAGAEMLCQGGNAMDAAVATAAALNVVEPYMSGLAGCGVMLISSARRRERVVLDYTGVTPQAADPARCTLDELKVGPKSVVTPGNLGGWLAALARFGSMERQRVLAPAIRLAEEGFTALDAIPRRGHSPAGPTPGAMAWRSRCEQVGCGR